MNPTFYHKTCFFLEVRKTMPRWWSCWTAGLFYRQMLRQRRRWSAHHPRASASWKGFWAEKSGDFLAVFFFWWGFQYSQKIGVWTPWSFLELPIPTGVWTQGPYSSFFFLNTLRILKRFDSWPWGPWKWLPGEVREGFGLHWAGVGFGQIFLSLEINVGVSKNRGTSKWMVYKGEPY